MNILPNLIRKYRPISSAIFCLASITVFFPSISLAQLSPENRNEYLISDNHTARESELPATTSANGKYTNLLQVLNCPSDRSRYGEFGDYESWDGGSWCGQTAPAGYRVWVYPNWYIWQNVATRKVDKIPASASANGKYSNLLQILNCPSDRSKYGEFDDYGSWSGSSWCGQDAQAGYWVWVYPNWYIWQKQK